MDNKKIYLSVVIPAYKEAGRIGNTLNKVSEYLAGQKYSSEIIVVVDGSPDNTSDVVEQLLPKIKNLRLIDNKENRGKGYVVRQGMTKAKGEIRVFMDADNSTSIDHIEKMFPEFDKGAEVVIGSRDIKGADIAVPQPWWRIALGNIFNLIVQIISGLWGIWDTQCGFKAFTAKAVDGIFPKCRIDRFAFDVEILALAKKMRYKVKEIPVRWINDTASTVNFKSMVKMLIDVVKIRWNVLLRRY